MIVLTEAMFIRVGDRIVNAGNTGDTTPTVFKVEEIDGCGWGNNVCCWLRLSGSDSRGVRHEVFERLPLNTPVYKVEQ